MQDGLGEVRAARGQGLEGQDEEDRKRRKVEQEKNEEGGTGDARQSEPMEETRGKTCDHGQKDRKPDNP